jgi:hypothetical protein
MSIPTGLLPAGITDRTHEQGVREVREEVTKLLESLKRAAGTLDLPYVNGIRVTCDELLELLGAP